MTIAFADASAYVKRYVREPGAEVLSEVDSLVVSSLSRVEVMSAVWRRERMGELPAARAAALAELVDADFDGRSNDAPEALAVSEQTLVVAADLLRGSDLRAGDAIQLASAITTRDAVPDCETMLCFDARLRAAALNAGFTVLPAEA